MMTNCSGGIENFDMDAPFEVSQGIKQMSIHSRRNQKENIDVCESRK